MSILLRAAEFFTPVLKESKFRETGVLTPEEFVATGDYLVYHCPTWKWQAGDPSKLKSYLPADKQFLITKNVPCQKRFKDAESVKYQETIIDENDDEGGWVDTQFFNEHEDQNVEIVDGDVVVGEEATEESFVEKTNVPATVEEEDSDAEDIESYMAQPQLDDELDQGVVDVTKLTNDVNGLNICSPNEIIKTRTYDLYITYDKYYQTPRLWLSGFDEYLKPLSIEDMYEDISQDHAKKTVTMESHPHIPGMMASVHPCRHAEMMKKIMNTMNENGKELKVDIYLIVFLKFVQSVIPTIQYDFTQNFTL